MENETTSFSSLLYFSALDTIGRKEVLRAQVDVLGTSIIEKNMSLPCGDNSTGTLARRDRRSPPVNPRWMLSNNRRNSRRASKEADNRRSRFFLMVCHAY